MDSKRLLAWCFAIAIPMAEPSGSQGAASPHAGAAAMAPMPPGPITVVDLATHYAAFHDRTQAMPPADRVDAFKAVIAPLLPDFYEASRLSGTEQAYDAAIRASFDEFPRLRTGIAEVAGRVHAMLEAAIPLFRGAFPDAGDIGPVYVVHALGSLDGGVRTIAGRDALVFGADVLAAARGERDERAFFQHELFHLYHRRFFAGCQGMWCSLWREGLATYAAHALTPDATDADLRLSTLRTAVDARLGEAVCRVWAALDSRNNAPYFSSGAALEGFPPRFGYYVGYLAAQAAAREHRLQDLAKLSAVDARPIVERALAIIAPGPPLEGGAATPRCGASRRVPAWRP